jgi:type II secretory pathway pseudopilin PulG
MQTIALHNRQRGTTLVEIIVSCVILAVLAISGMTALCETGAGLAIQKNRRIALGIANSRLEELRTVPYIALTALISKNYNTNAIGKVSGQFALLPGETVSIGGQPMSMTTTIQYADVDGGSSTYDYLRMTTSVQYHGVNDQVTLQTMRGP